eukprot:1149402-Pelagomonas_calceolata.AAC.9
MRRCAVAFPNCLLCFNALNRTETSSLEWLIDFWGEVEPPQRRLKYYSPQYFQRHKHFSPSFRECQKKWLIPYPKLQLGHHRRGGAAPWLQGYNCTSAILQFPTGMCPGFAVVESCGKALVKRTWP